MVVQQLGLLGRIYVRPLSAMGAVLDRGRWFAAIALCAVVAIAFGYRLSPLETRVTMQKYTEAVEEASGVPRAAAKVAALDTTEHMVGSVAPFVSGFKVPVLLLLVFAPVALVLARAFGGGGIVSEQVAPLSTCLAFAYAGAFLPAALAAFAGAPASAVLAAIAAGLAFVLLLASSAIRMVTGSSFAGGAGAAACGAAACTAAVSVLGSASAFSGLLLSPWILYLLYMRFGGSVSGLGDTFRQQQSFRRYLEASTINPHDADAHYQLGLIYQRRGQVTDAAERFQKAIAIDPKEVDAQYQLARLLKAKGEWARALPHLEASIRIDPKHAQYEPARDWAIAKLHLGDSANARITLESYLQQRPYDPEALFYMGKLLSESGERSQAREFLERAVEAVRTTPRYRRHEVRRWQSEAASLIRSL